MDLPWTISSGHPSVGVLYQDVPQDEILSSQTVGLQQPHNETQTYPNQSSVNNTYGNEDYVLPSLIEYTVAVRLWQWACPVLLTVGCLGNVLSLVVLLSKHMRNGSCIMALSTLSVVDLCVLSTGLLRHWIVALSGLDIRNLSRAGCKIHTFLTYYSGHLSSWTVMIIAAERMLSVWWPLHMKRWCNQCRFTIWWSVVAISLACINAPILWIIDLQLYKRAESHDNSTQNLTVHMNCRVLDDYINYGHKVLHWVDFILLCCAPFLGILILNTLILIRVKCCRKIQSTSQKSLSSTTVMLILVSMVFLLTTLPITIYFLGANAFFTGFDLQTAADSFLMYSVCNLIYYLNNSINFLLYCLGGSKFRKAAYRTFLLRCKGKHSENSNRRIVNHQKPNRGNIAEVEPPRMRDCDQKNMVTPPGQTNLGYENPEDDFYHTDVNSVDINHSLQANNNNCVNVQENTTENDEHYESQGIMMGSTRSFTAMERSSTEADVTHAEVDDITCDGEDDSGCHFASSSTQSEDSTNSLQDDETNIYMIEAYGSDTGDDVDPSVMQSPTLCEESDNYEYSMQKDTDEVMAYFDDILQGRNGGSLQTESTVNCIYLNEATDCTSF